MPPNNESKRDPRRDDGSLRDEPCRTPGCNYSMIRVDGEYVCTKCFHVYSDEIKEKRDAAD